MAEMLYRDTASSGSGLDFVLSDGSLDRHGTRINPKGWQLDQFRKNPVALFGHDKSFPIGTWSNVRIEGDRLLGRLVPAAKGTSERVDEIVSLVEQGILRAVSAGFAVIEMGKAGKSIFDFEKQVLHEASIVAVPSNTNALAFARGLNISDDTLNLVFGEQATQTRDGNFGGHATKPPHKKASTMEPLATRILNAQNELNTARDALTDYLSTDNDGAKTGELSEAVETARANLDNLQRAERALSTGSSNGNQQQRQQVQAPPVRRPLGIKIREPKPGDMVIRAAVVSVLSQTLQRDPIAVLEERYGDHEATQTFVRAAVDPAKTTVQGWASELIETETVAFLETLRDLTFYPRLAALGSNLQFGQGRGAIKIPSRASTPSISGSFVAEGEPIPVRRLGLTSITLNPHKMGVISYFTKEMAKYSNPQIENLLRQEIRGDTADTIDTLLTDATAGSSTRPAGLLYNVAGLTASTAGGPTAILEDIETLAAPFDAAKAGRNLVLLMNKREMRRLVLMPRANGTLGMTEVLEKAGITPIGSTNVPAGRLILIDAADFATAAGDQPEFDVSEAAVIHAENTAPAQIGTAGTPNTVAAPVVSMFQTASIALRMLLDVTWAMRRTGLVQWMDGVDWSYSE